MVQYDEETERYLKEFRPRAVRELDLAPPPRSILWRRLAAAAAVALCAGALLWFARPELTRSNKTADVQTPMAGVTSQRQRQTTLFLTKLALADNERFETLLEEESRRSLPRFQGEHSGLKDLAKE
jgi:hypothetical protein